MRKKLKLSGDEEDQLAEKGTAHFLEDSERLPGR